MKVYRINLWERTPSSADTWTEDYDSYREAQKRIDEINKKMRSMYAPNPADYSIGVDGEVVIVHLNALDALIDQRSLAHEAATNSQ